MKNIYLKSTNKLKITPHEINLYPYAQITRNKKHDDVMGFYILHEGFIGVFDGELKEDDYDDIKEKITRNADNGWLGITDKYWVTAVVPPKIKILNPHFCIKTITGQTTYLIHR